MKMLHSRFVSASGGVEEHFFAGTAQISESFAADLAWLWESYTRSMYDAGCSSEDEFLLRFHLSDPANQGRILRQFLGERKSFVSVIGQAPAGSRIALEAWHWKNWRNMKNYTPCWFQMDETFNANTDWTNHAAASAYEQTAAEFARLDDFLKERGMDVELNTIRTWLYCKDVDNNYAGLVKARNDYFATRGLTSQSHFIASTGIAGECEDPHRLVRMDSLSFTNIRREQIKFLYALENLSPTALYGVSFERGVKVCWGDRAHYLISGTASIDSKGEVVAPGDVRAQSARIIENVSALLAEQGGELSNIKWGTLYMRDVADCSIILDQLHKSGFPEDVPLVALQASVCRPGWLVELECVAVKAEINDFPILG